MRKVELSPEIETDAAPKAEFPGECYVLTDEAGNELSAEKDEWPDFVAIHRKDFDLLSAEEYRALPHMERQNYRIAHYAVLKKKDTGEIVERIFRNDGFIDRAKLVNAQ